MTGTPKGAAGRLVHLLKLVAEGPPRFLLRDLATRAALPQSTVHRLLQVLVESGMVERGQGQSYRQGRELHRMASQLVARFDLTRSARPYLEKLVADWQETAVLCAYSPVERKAVIADVLPTPHPLRFAVEVGVEINLPWGSLGRAILAFLPPGEVEAVIRAADLGPLTGRPRAPRSELGAELELIRQTGSSRYFDPEIDIAGISSPIFGSEGEILGCIGVTMPSRRFQLHLEDNLLSDVRKAAENLTAQVRIAHS